MLIPGTQTIGCSGQNQQLLHAHLIRVVQLRAGQHFLDLDRDLFTKEPWPLTPHEYVQLFGLEWVFIPAVQEIATYLHSHTL